MEIRCLRTLLTISRVGSFSAAAAKLGYAQSTVSMQISQLEEEIGKPLFERIGRKTYLTNEGKMLAEYAARIVGLADEIVAEIENPDLVEGNLRIGISESIGSVFLPSVLASFRMKYPAVHVSICTADSNELMNKLRSNALDLIWTFNNEEDAEEIKLLLKAKSAMSIVGSPSFVGKRVIDSIRQLAGSDFILGESSCPYRHQLLSELEKNNVGMRLLFEIDNTEIIRNLCVMGEGFAYLPDFLTEDLVNRGKLVRLRLEDFHPYMYNKVLCLKNKVRSGAINKFIEEIRNDVKWNSFSEVYEYGK